MPIANATSRFRLISEESTPITGHIDLAQVRQGCIHILDYKPKAEKVQPISQLTIYALALASHTKLPLKHFKCAWFDEPDYFEFFPCTVCLPDAPPNTHPLP